MNKKTLFLTLLTTIALPTLALAEVSITGMADSVVQIALYVASAVVVVLWIVTGILFLTAQGDPSKLTAAKTALLSAIIGTVLVIIASGALSLVKNALHL